MSGETRSSYTWFCAGESRSSSVQGVSTDVAFRYENEDVALNTGTILKELLRYENLARILLYSDECVSGGKDDTAVSVTEDAILVADFTSSWTISRRRALERAATPLRT